MLKSNFPRQQFQTVGALQPGRAVFDLSNARALPADFGYLYPVVAEEAVPGDVFSLSADVVARMMPTIAPVMHEVNIYVHYWFIPYRLLWPKVDESGNDWESYITGGEHGDNAAVLPKWSPSLAETAVGSLWDYFGLPPNVVPHSSVLPFDFLRRAYNLVWNEWYRDENLQEKQALTNPNLLVRSWEKDYFTSSLLAQQKGTPPALPISGSTHAVWDNPVAANINALGPGFPVKDASAPSRYVQSSTGTTGVQMNTASGVGGTVYVDLSAPASGTGKVTVPNVSGLNSNTVDLSVASTFDISDLRLAFQVQKWMERNMRAGTRYTEYLQAHFGVSPRDSRLQRPEYIGGLKSPVVISEVLQTSATQSGVTPQGNMAGHGISVSRQHGGKYRAEEFGLILGLLSVMPRSMYTQGVERQFVRETRYDFYSPEFAHLSEQAVYKGELFVDGSAADGQIFGYQARYQEYRFRASKAVGKLRTTLGYWNLARKFTSRPALNSAFIQVENQVLKDRIFAVPSEPGFIVTVGNRVVASRPMPATAEPGLIDHF